MGHKIKISRRAALAVGAALTGELLLGTASRADSPKRRALVWSEGTAPKDVYPEDVNTPIAEGLRSLPDWEIATASINDPDQGVSNEALAATDVLLWWGHVRHRDVKDELVERIVRRVKEEGMGFIAIHSSHFSKALRSLLGTRCGFSAYVCDGSSVDVIVKAKDHPIAEGVNNFTLAQTERYSEPFEVPEPEAVVFDGEAVKKSVAVCCGRHRRGFLFEGRWSRIWKANGGLRRTRLTEGSISVSPVASLPQNSHVVTPLLLLRG